MIYFSPSSHLDNVGKQIREKLQGAEMEYNPQPSAYKQVF